MDHPPDRFDPTVARAMLQRFRRNVERRSAEPPMTDWTSDHQQQQFIREDVERVPVDAQPYYYGLPQPVMVPYGYAPATKRPNPCSNRRRTATARPRERHSSRSRSAARRATRSSASSSPPGEPPAADPPPAAYIDNGLRLLGYWAANRAQERAFEAALLHLEELLNGDRLDDEQLDDFVEGVGERWPSDYREDFAFWIGAEHADLFARPSNGRSKLVEPMSHGPWLEPIDDDEAPF